MKRQADENEEEMARVAAQKRKLQRDVEEQTEQAEQTQRELEQLRSKLRTGAASDKARSVCHVTRPLLNFGIKLSRNKRRCPID